jgi:hypothetical protein
MPAMENMKIAMASAIAGSERPRPARSSTPSTARPLRRMAMSTAKAPMFMAM